MRRMLIGVVLLLLLVAGLDAGTASRPTPANASDVSAASGPAAGSAAKRRRCRRGQTGAVVRGRRFSSSRTKVFGGRRLRRGQRLVCARFRKPGRGAAGAFRATARLMRSGHLQRRQTRRLFKRRLGRLSLRLRGTTDRSFLRTLGGAGIAGAGARSAGAQGPLRSAAPETRQINDSTTMESQSRQTDEAPDERGQYTEVDSELTTDGKKAGKVPGKIKKGMLMGEGASFKTCPNSSGTVRGEYKRRQRESSTVDFPGRTKGSYSIATTVEAKLEAHVGDDALAKDYEYRGIIEIEVRATDQEGRRLPTRVFRIRFSNSGLDPRKGWQNAFGAGSKAEAEGFGPRGRVSGKELELATVFWSLSDLLLQEKAREQLLAVEKIWRDGRCVEVDGGPDGRVVDTGGSVRVDAVARSKQDGQAVQPADVSAAVCTKFYEGGTVSPSKASNPGSFTYRDPGRTWKPDKNDHDPPCLRFESVSRRGIGTGSTTFKVRDAHFFRATLQARDEFTWSKSYESVTGEGTSSECRISGSGSGTWSAFFTPKPGASQVVSLTGDQLATNGDMAVLGSVVQDGTYNESGCRTFNGDRSACGQRNGDGTAELDVAGPGRLSANAGGPFHDILNPCPITWPVTYDSFGNPTNEDVGPFPGVNNARFVLPMAELKDPRKAKVEVWGGGTPSATEFCSAAGSNNGGQCGPEETVTVTGSKLHLWKLTLTRIPSP